MFYIRSKLLIVFFWLSVGFLFSGCMSGAVNKKATPPAPEKAELLIINSHRQKNMQNDGSLWETNGLLNELFANNKARRVGDIVTIKIVESSSATNKATTKTGRSSSLAGSIDGFFNMGKRYPSSHPFFNPFSQIKGGLDTDFDGSGTTHRSGDLNAYITTKVVEVLENGNLKISG